MAKWMQYNLTGILNLKPFHPPLFYKIIMEQYFHKKIVEYACLCGILSPLTKLYFCRHCLFLRCAFCCHHEVSKLAEIAIRWFDIWLMSVYRWILISAPTVWKTSLHRKLSWERTSATPVSIAHHVSLHYLLAPLKFKFQCSQKMKVERNPLKILKWSRRKCTI